MKLNLSSLIKVMAIAALYSSPVYSQTITTVAGNGTYGYMGDGSAAIGANLALPVGLQNEGSGVVIDHSGNMLIADEYNNVIRKVNASGVISTIVGTGFGAASGTEETGDYNGDGIAATAADLNNPSGLAIDAAGNIYIADYYNYRIRKVNTSGIISTIAGNGTSGYAGDGGAATAATLGTPNSVAVDAAGNVYFSDDQNHVVRKVSATTGIITNVAGTGTSGYNGDFIAATTAQLYSPWGIAFDASGNIYIADDGNNRVRKVNSSGIISTVAGNGMSVFSGDGVISTSTAVAEPRSIVFNAHGGYYIAEGDGRIREVNASGITSTVAGNGTNGYSGDGGSATLAALNRPIGVALDAIGNIYIVDEENDRIRMVNSGTLQTSNVLSRSTAINVSPNPSNGSFSFNIFSANNEEAQVIITNIAGEKVQELSITTNISYNIKLEQPAGIYLFSATTPDGCHTVKIELE
jgi:sugar lactone lactonase YvrE